MVEAPNDRTVAILMDFENTKDANLQRILSSGAGFGQVIIRRAYADWTRFSFAQNSLREAGFEAVHQFTTGAGSKNATDINLTVDAMDIMWSRPVDVFVLVTADSDFAKLAMRLREGGKKVIGIGAKGRVGRALVQACDQYIYYDEGPQQKGRRGRRGGRGRGRTKEASPARKKAEGVKISEGHKLVLAALDSAMDEDGNVYGSPLHRSMRRLSPDFSYRDAGFSSFRSYIENLAPVIGTETDDERSDFLVWVEEEYEDEAWAAIEAVPAGTENGDRLVLSDEVQERIDQTWKSAARRGRLSGSKAGSIVAEEYGADKLSDTPLRDLDGVLTAAPRLANRWKRDKSVLIRA